MIKNAKDNRIDESPMLTDVSAGIKMMMQNVKIKLIDKSNINGNLQETVKREFNVMAFKVVYKPQEVDIKEEGERAWKWFKIRTPEKIGIKVDDIIKFQGTNYRVKNESDAKEYGTIAYIVIEDFQ